LTPAEAAAPPGAADDAGGWRPRDCHAHTTFSDGALDPEALVATAAGAPGTFAVRGQAAMHMFQRAWPAGLDSDAYMDAHVATLERFAREMPVDVLAHPTLLPIPLRERPLEELWTEPREERAVRALVAAGVAFEVSNRYRPHERFVRRAAEAGVRLSLGSDGHSHEQVGDLAWPLALARACGVADDALYDPLAHGRRGA